MNAWPILIPTAGDKFNSAYLVVFSTFRRCTDLQPRPGQLAMRILELFDIEIGTLLGRQCVG